MRRFDERGPYRLLGYSFGGLIAFEVARQIADAGGDVSFLGIIDNKSQEKIFTNSLRYYYPGDTRFVVLPMDYSFMGYGKPIKNIDEQLQNLSNLRDRFPNQIIPFVHIDPQHHDAVDRVKMWITEKQFKGVKIYPPFGYPPTHERLMKIYEFCESHGEGIQ